MLSHFGPQKLTVAPHLTPLTLTWCGIRAPGWVPRCFISVTMDITMLGREMCPSVPLQDCGRNPLWSVKVQSELHSGYFCFSLSIFHFFEKTAGLHWSWCMLFVVETSCGSPPIIESTKQVWNNNSSPGSTVLYFCKEGFHKKGENVSVCHENGQWSIPSLVCKGIYDIFCSSVSTNTWFKDEFIYEKSIFLNLLILFPFLEIFCGNPPILPHTGQMWNGSSNPGSAVAYYCKIGFYHHEGTNMSMCTSKGYWTQPSIACKGKKCAIKLVSKFTFAKWFGKTWRKTNLKILFPHSSTL